VGRAVADREPRPSGQQRRLVDDRAVDVQDRDLLERDDVGAERGDEPGDRLQAVQADVPPPRRRKRLAGADPRPDVPGDDAEPAGRARRVRCDRAVVRRREVAALAT
jgi:hypothetical protein